MKQPENAKIWQKKKNSFPSLAILKIYQSQFKSLEVLFDVSFKDLNLALKRSNISLRTWKNYPDSLGDFNRGGLFVLCSGHFRPLLTLRGSRKSLGMFNGRLVGDRPRQQRVRLKRRLSCLRGVWRRKRRGRLVRDGHLCVQGSVKWRFWCYLNPPKVTLQSC